jgi:exosortase
MIVASSYRWFAVLWVASLLIWWHTIAATVELAMRQSPYTHILLILPISIALIVQERQRQRWKPKPSLRAGATLLGIAVLAGVAGCEWGRTGIITPDVHLSLSMLAVVIWWIGAFALCFGSQGLSACSFPLCFLFWLIPIPNVILNDIIYALQTGSAYAAHALFAIARVPVTQDGVRLSVPGLNIEVARECSSIRSSLMLAVTTMVMAHLLLRSIPGKAFVILSVIPLSVAKNGLRIFILSMLGVYVDQGFLHGKLHRDGGVLFFLLFLAGLFVLLRLVGWAEHRARTRLTIPNIVPPVGMAKVDT